MEAGRRLLVSLPFALWLRRSLFDFVSSPWPLMAVLREDGSHTNLHSLLTATYINNAASETISFDPLYSCLNYPESPSMATLTP